GVKDLKKSNKNGCFLGWFEDSQDKAAEDAGLWLPITAEGSRDTNKTARLRTAVIQTKPHGWGQPCMVKTDLRVLFG
ncbi:MAG: hypothetical protein ACKO9Q_05215, partial [Pirellula sp.]